MGGLKMKENATLNNILNLYEKEIAKNVKNKNRIYYFEKNKMQNIAEIIKIIKSSNYKIEKYNIFMISEPKHRIIMALNIKDKIINHYIAKYVLEEKLTKYLDDRNIATRKNMGTDYGIKMIKKFIEKNKKYSNFYVLKMDISKYFYTIDHDVLLNLLKDKLNKDEYNFLQIIIDSTNYDYINKEINNIKNKFIIKKPKCAQEIEGIPCYEEGKGLPIGNMTSQFLSIFYLYELDHYIVNNLHIKYYIRYMDDFVLIHHDKNVLKQALKEIENILDNVYKLKLNNKKTKIVSIKEGFSFLGYTYKVINNKTIIKIKKESYENIKRKIKEIHNRYKYHRNISKPFMTIMSYWYNRKYGSQLRVRRIINRCWFKKLEYEK